MRWCSRLRRSQSLLGEPALSLGYRAGAARLHRARVPLELTLRAPPRWWGGGAQRLIRQEHEACPTLGAGGGEQLGPVCLTSLLGGRQGTGFISPSEARKKGNGGLQQEGLGLVLRRNCPLPVASNGPEMPRDCSRRERGFRRGTVAWLLLPRVTWGKSPVWPRSHRVRFSRRGKGCPWILRRKC